MRTAGRLVYVVAAAMTVASCSSKPTPPKQAILEDQTYSVVPRDEYDKLMAARSSSPNFVKSINITVDRRDDHLEVNYIDQSYTFRFPSDGFNYQECSFVMPIIHSDRIIFNFQRESEHCGPRLLCYDFEGNLKWKFVDARLHGTNFIKFYKDGTKLLINDFGFMDDAGSSSVVLVLNSKDGSVHRLFRYGPKTGVGWACLAPEESHFILRLDRINECRRYELQ